MQEREDFWYKLGEFSADWEEVQVVCRKKAAERNVDIQFGLPSDTLSAFISCVYYYLKQTLALFL